MRDRSLILAAEMKEILSLQSKLAEAFGPLALDLGIKGFRHFGVDIKHDKKMNMITASQLSYVNDLREITLPTRCNKLHPCTPELVTEYRALVSAVAWVGVTYPWALASASMLQGCLPSPTFGDITKLNNNVLQLKQEYLPLIYQRLRSPLRLVSVGDSSFANSDRYSQQGYMILLASEKDTPITGTFTVLDFRSNKSKRVATSTMHAEALAKLNGLESALFIQSYFLELQELCTSPLTLLSPEPEKLIKILSLTDCHDLHESLVAPAQPNCSNKHLNVYMSAIRELKSSGRVQSFLWIDTRDMLVNGLTKLKEDGMVNLDEVKDVWKTFQWKLHQSFRWQRTWCTE